MHNPCIHTCYEPGVGRDQVDSVEYGYGATFDSEGVVGNSRSTSRHGQSLMIGTTVEITLAGSKNVVILHYGIPLA